MTFPFQQDFFLQPGDGQSRGRHAEIAHTHGFAKLPGGERPCRLRLGGEGRQQYIGSIYRPAGSLPAAARRRDAKRQIFTEIAEQGEVRPGPHMHHADTTGIGVEMRRVDQLLCRNVRPLCHVFGGKGFEGPGERLEARDIFSTNCLS